MGGAAVRCAIAAGVDGVGGADRSLPSSGPRLERIRWIGFFGGPAGGGPPAEPESIAEKGRFGGGSGEAGGGPWDRLPTAREGDAVWARGGGGAGEGFSGSVPACSFG